MIYVDCTEQGAYSELMRAYYVYGLPTIVLTNSSGERLDEVVGDVPSGAVLQKFNSVSP